MIWRLLLISFSLSTTLLYPNGRTEFSVQLGGAPSGCSPWAGPGVYYGVWFNSPNDYYGWCNARYYGPGVQIWYGPGWYGGVWFDNEREWHNHRNTNININNRNTNINVNNRDRDRRGDGNRGGNVRERARERGGDRDRGGGRGGNR